MNPGHYVPVLTGKLAEITAIGKLPISIRSGLTPLLDIPPMTLQPDRDGEPAKPPDPVAKLNGLFTKLEKSWQKERHILIDLDGFEQYRPRGEHPVEFVSRRTPGRDLRFELVVSNRSTVAYQNAAVGTRDRWVDFCLRVHVTPEQEPSHTAAEIERLSEVLGLAPTFLDLIIDLGRIVEHKAEPIEVAKQHLAAIPELRRWKGVTLASTLVPDDPHVPAGELKRFRRLDWQLWREVTSKGIAGVGFGDYSITGPRLPDDSFRGRPAPHLRYTTQNALLWWRGHLDNAELEPDEERVTYPDLCKRLVERSDCKPLEYSWGDEMIHTFAARPPGPGNFKTWVEHASNHHLTLVVNALRAGRY
jgi:hypothetical protein